MPRKAADSTSAQPDAANGGRVGLWIVGVVAAVPALVFLPALTFPLIALVFLGVACARSAIINRQIGWISGFVFGMVLTVAGLAGIVGVLAMRLGWNS